MSTETTAPKRRTKRRYAHELYPHADEWETRPLTVEVPYWYARFIGLNPQGTGWPTADGAEKDQRIAELSNAARTALLADALHQGMTGDEAWTWADERLGDGLDAPWRRAVKYGVTTGQIKPYPCGPALDYHEHLIPSPLGEQWRQVVRVPGIEDDCPECTEPIPETENTQ